MILDGVVRKLNLVFPSHSPSTEKSCVGLKPENGDVECKPRNLFLRSVLPGSPHLASPTPLGSGRGTGIPTPFLEWMGPWRGMCPLAFVSHWTVGVLMGPDTMAKQFWYINIMSHLDLLHLLSTQAKCNCGGRNFFERQGHDYHFRSPSDCILRGGYPPNDQIQQTHKLLTINIL